MTLAEGDWNLPNALSVLRLALVPVCLWLAFRRRLGFFLGCLAASEFFDLIDGPIARANGAVTTLGNGLDGWGDFAAYTTLPFAALWLFRAHFLESTKVEAPDHTAVWSTSGVGPNLETVCLGKSRAELTDWLGEPDAVTSGKVFYRNILFQDPGQPVAARNVEFTFANGVVSRVAVGGYNHGDDLP